jgi:hypothetical protein
MPAEQRRDALARHIAVQHSTELSLCSESKPALCQAVRLLSLMK